MYAGYVSGHKYKDGRGIATVPLQVYSGTTTIDERPHWPGGSQERGRSMRKIGSLIPSRKPITYTIYTSRCLSITKKTG